jgi:hypothetical protein
MKPDEVNAHTNQYAEGSVSAQTFSERKKIEHDRKKVNSYQFSQLGTNFISKGEYAREKIRVPGRKHEHPRTRQEVNAGGFSGVSRRSNVPQTRQQTNAQNGRTAFREPPSRGYNPYT